MRLLYIQKAYQEAEQVRDNERIKAEEARSKQQQEHQAAAQVRAHRNVESHKSQARDLLCASSFPP